MSMLPETPLEIAIEGSLLLAGQAAKITKLFPKRGIITTTRHAESAAAREVLKARLALEEAGVLKPGTGKLTINIGNHPIVDESTLSKLAKVEIYYQGNKIKCLTSFAEQQMDILKKNVGYNISPEKWFHNYFELV